jgi:integral membrane protein
MALKPKLSDVPQIRRALKFYRVFAYITGIFLLLLVFEMVLKYTPIQREIEVGGPNGFIALVPDNAVTGFNLSTGILIAHGWLYVVYLFSDFRLWSLMRWPFSRFIQIALGGVVPFLSFFVEHFITQRVQREIAELEATAQPVATAEVTH